MVGDYLVLTTSSPVSEGKSTNAAKMQALAAVSRTRYFACEAAYAAAIVRWNNASFVVTCDGTMPVGEATRTLDQIQARFQAVESALIRERFTAALWLSNTVNGSSAVTPGRSMFTVPGLTGQIDYGEVLRMLGADAQRFFRAYADDIAEVNRQVLAVFDPGDPITLDNWAWVMGVAACRGLAKFPYLAHDSADACRRLDSAERAALAASKAIDYSSVALAAAAYFARYRSKTDLS